MSATKPAPLSAPPAAALATTTPVIRAATRPGGSPAETGEVRQPGEPGSQPGGGGRLAWLDALRGMAALCVVYAHFGARVFTWLHVAIYRVFDPGLYGVVVFFLISGYIVPASLERRGSVRTFWVSRLFRLFPLFLLVVAITLFLHIFNLASVQDTGQNVAASVLSHLFMLSDLLAGTNIIVVIWTLAYEMVFYLVLTALFTAGLHRRSSTFAVTFAAAALLLGGLLPTAWLSDNTIGRTQIAVTADILVIGGLALAVLTRGVPRALGAWLAALTGLILVAFNERRDAYEGLSILALMFTGTMLYRARRGQISRRRAAIVAAGILAAVITAGYWHIPQVSPSSQPAILQHEWVTSVALAGLTFALGLTMQERRVPRPLAWLGLVSYSVYLVFPLLLDLYDDIPFPAAYRHLPWLQAAATVLYLGALLACAALTHRLVEAPMQQLGRRVAARFDARGRQVPALCRESRQAPRLRAAGLAAARHVPALASVRATAGHSVLRSR
jgi:peptidoglycan/LPS O-acetylase OafA/YrhL